jgi:hypothetical protein
MSLEGLKMAMDLGKLRNVIAVQFLTVMGGSIDVRVAYCGILIDNCFYYAKRVELEPNLMPAVNLRNRLIQTFDLIAASRVNPDRQDGEEEYKRVSEIFKKYVILVNDTPGNHVNVKALHHLEQLRVARNHFLNSCETYASYLSGDKEGLSSTLTEMAEVLRLVGEVAYDLELVSFSEGEWRKNATVGQSHPGQPEPPAR